MSDLIELAENRQMPDHARPDITLGELREALAAARDLALADVRREVERTRQYGWLDPAFLLAILDRLSGEKVG